VKSERKIFRPSSIIHRPSSIGYFMALVLFLCACPAIGTIYLNDGGIHDIDYKIEDSLWVDYGTPGLYTTVNWLDGGKISDALCGYKNSRISISGGTVRNLNSWDSSQVDVSGGSIYAYLVSCDSSQVDIFGGSICELCSYHSSQVDISGGSISEFGSYDSSHVKISGGSISGEWLRSYDTSQVDISGGSIGVDALFELCDESMVQIFGYDFAVDGQPVGYGELTSIHGGHPYNEPLRHLTGTLLSGEFIDKDFRIGHDAKIVLTIPEPATVLLLGLGGLALRKRRR